MGVVSRQRGLCQPWNQRPSDKLIDTIDPDGVALAAIQGLNSELQERLAEKDSELDQLRARVERLELLAMSK